MKSWIKFFRKQVFTGLFALIMFFGCSSVLIGQEWSLKKDEKGIKVWTAEKEGSKIRQFKAEMNITANLENVVAVLIDVEKMQTWYDRIDSAVEIERENEVTAIYFIKFGLPWPVKDRYAIVKSNIDYNREKRQVRIKSMLAEGSNRTSEGLVKVSMLESGWTLEEREGGKVHILHYGHMDPSGNVPAWLANSSVEKGPIKTMSRLVSKLSEYSEIRVAIMHNPIR